MFFFFFLCWILAFDLHIGPARNRITRPNLSYWICPNVDFHPWIGYDETKSQKKNGSTRALIRNYAFFCSRHMCPCKWIQIQIWSVSASKKKKKTHIFEEAEAQVSTMQSKKLDFPEYWQMNFRGWPGQRRSDMITISLYIPDRGITVHIQIRIWCTPAGPVLKNNWVTFPRVVLCTPGTKCGPGRQPSCNARITSLNIRLLDYFSGLHGSQV